MLSNEERSILKLEPLFFSGKLKDVDVIFYFFIFLCKLQRGQYYTTFYGRNLPISIISSNVCPWQAFPALSNVCG